MDTVNEKEVTQPDDSPDNGDNLLVSPQSEKEGVTFTQEQVNKLIAKEKKKAKEPYADYDAIKLRNSELETQVKEVKTTAATIEQQLKATKTKESIDNALKEFPTLVDGELAKELLLKTAFVYDEDGNVSNAKNLIQEILTKHPILTRKATPDNDVIKTTQPEDKKFSLNPSYNSQFFKGGGYTQVQVPLTINGTQ